MKKDSLGDRMKSFYENAYRIHLPMRIPLIIRNDGRSFHNYLKGCKRPFDENVIHAMNIVATELCKEIQGAKIAYTQSDEISILVINYTSLESEAWFQNNIQKMASVSAGIASSVMTEESIKIFGKIKRAVFDSRVFLTPVEDTNNYFYFRQQDATRNSVQMAARAIYSHKECNNKNNSQLQEMLFQKGINWNNLPTSQKRGRCIIKRQFEKNGAIRNEWVVDNEIPIFSQNKNYIEDLMKRNEKEILPTETKIADLVGTIYEKKII